ncbi:putative AC4 protein [Tomato chlorotic mottle virus]|uniref:AC4 protein n=2 Tax=Tomato chlorotic mottle virus TaxID=172391 RepID=Q77DK4_9GEMI|nr:putative AC4 protein [Tomato chlorotic mottle virus]AAL82852.1 putative AC4 protein [Tomato chlorotic mottle virus]AAM12757.1 putative AC4 protein [Tomato chlorotic mottle virus-[Brazil]]
MGNLISTCSSSSKVNTTARTTSSSTSYPQPGQHISIRTFRELRAPQTSNHTWRKTETSLIMEFSRSMEDQQEEVSNLPTTRTPRFSTQDQSWKHSIY